MSSNLPEGFRSGVPGARLTTYGIGGPILSLYEPNSAEELAGLVKRFQQAGLRFRVLGGGSNLLIPDEGITEPVIRLGTGFRFWERLPSNRARVGAAMPYIRLSQETAQSGLSGLEFAGGIPAWFGGAVRMNAGAHGSDTAAVLESAKLVTYEGDIVDIPASQFGYSYRKSRVGELGIVIEGTLKLVEGNSDDILAVRAKNLSHRKSAQPITLPSAGSVFKNPAPDLTAGIVIERSGLKGFRVGGAEVSNMHGNWIVNPEGAARASDVKACIQECQRVVRDKFNINLETELVVW
jgi:UDP-N-acetylmuramate dehydrogenase